MPQIFPRWVNEIPGRLQLSAILLITLVILGFWYFGSPEYLETGYAPNQPIPFSHTFHVTELGIDCQYCHGGAWESAVAGIPSTQTCMTCHEYVGLEHETLQPLRDSWESGMPVEWIRVHDLPDHAYFNHSIHVNAGIGCVSCHGRVDRMDVVMKTESMSMGWCLDCHNNPAPHLRPTSEITNMAWEPPENHMEFAQMLIEKRNIDASVYCNACHR
ncbi:cytochrome c3 family protein [Balneolaceae bacterium ANBcel3]|nr:cytochrome c3 family protein [Balneolaceae bacterium ANBcel3]